MNCQKCKSWEEMYDRAKAHVTQLQEIIKDHTRQWSEARRLRTVAEQALREILISHGQYGDGGNLDKFTRQKCLEVLQASDRRSNAEVSDVRGAHSLH